MSPATPLTDEEYLNMPEMPGKHELLDGELISLPPAKRYHNSIGWKLLKRLRGAVDEDRLFLAEGYRLKRGWLIPDVSVNWPGQPVGEWFEGAPMVAIEIVSRGNTAVEIERKTEAHLAE